MEIRLPIKVNGIVRWPQVTYERSVQGNRVEKIISVRGNPLKQVLIQPWLEEGRLVRTSKKVKMTNQGRGHVGKLMKAASKSTLKTSIRKSD